MTSNPIICRKTSNVSMKDNGHLLYTKVRPEVSHDCIHLILYGVHSNLTSFLIGQCMNEMSKISTMKELLHDMMTMCRHGLDFERAVFLLLLNINMGMKETICKGFPNENVNGISKEKSASFLNALSKNVVPAWQGNEFKNVHDLVEAARSAYLVA